jgi:hypothetical protein
MPAWDVWALPRMPFSTPRSTSHTRTL